MSAAQKETSTPIDEKKLESAIAAHLKFLLRQPGGVRANFQRLALGGRDFTDRRLTEADFTGAVLAGASFLRADLERATLYCCDLRDADLQQAKLCNADMRGTSLHGARLSFANLDGADFRAARMMVAGGDKVAMVSRMSIRQAEAGQPAQSTEGVDFRNCSMKGASLKGANLKGADFSNALLQGAKFAGATLSNVTFENAVLTGVNLYELKVPAVALKGAITEPKAEAFAKLPELRHRIVAHRIWIELRAKEGAGAILDDEDLRPLQNLLQKALLTALSACRVLAIGVNFSGSQLQGAQFDGADLREANFAFADLRGASFRGAKLAHAKFTGANIAPLDLAGGRKHVTDFSGADMSAEQLRAAAS